ncbi:MAG: ribonuclease P protein component, partial [Acidimicrobiales bacterium]
GRAARGPLRVAYAQVSGETPGLACVGYAVGRRHGNAVTRNRLRRRLRAVAREVEAAGGLAPGAYLVSARPEATALDTRALRTAFEAATRAATSSGGAP